jgi:hypothetical protein
MSLYRRIGAFLNRWLATSILCVVGLMLVVTFALTSCGRGSESSGTTDPAAVEWQPHHAS